MNDCRFGVSPVNYPDPDPDIYFVYAHSVSRSHYKMSRPVRDFVAALAKPFRDLCNLIVIVNFFYHSGIAWRSHLCKWGLSKHCRP